MSRANERPETLFNRSQHELDQLRFYCMDPNTEKATLKAQLDNSNQHLTHFRQRCREQEDTIKELRSQVYEAEAEEAVPEPEFDYQAGCEEVRRDSRLDLFGKTVAPETQRSTRYHAPTVESVSDEEFGNAVSSEHRQETTNHVLEVFLTFVSVTDSRMTDRQTVYVRQQQSLREVIGPQVFGRFSTDAITLVYKAEQIHDVGQTAVEVSTMPTRFRRTCQLTTGPS
jgi:hypothetical protein